MGGAAGRAVTVSMDGESGGEGAGGARDGDRAAEGSGGDSGGAGRGTAADGCVGGRVSFAARGRVMALGIEIDARAGEAVASRGPAGTASWSRAAGTGAGAATGAASAVSATEGDVEVTASRAVFVAPLGSR
jgi:hypothetical protein